MSGVTNFTSRSLLICYHLVDGGGFFLFSLSLSLKKNFRYLIAHRDLNHSSNAVFTYLRAACYAIESSINIKGQEVSKANVPYRP